MAPMAGSFSRRGGPRRDLAAPPVIESNTRLKYSNRGFGLAGLVIEEVTGVPYRNWVKQVIIEPAGFEETEPDMPAADSVPFARGHSGKPPQTPILGANGNSIGMGRAAVPLSMGLHALHRPRGPYFALCRQSSGRQRQRTNPRFHRGGILRHLDRRRDAALGGGSLAFTSVCPF
jgi:CubicO group peptidase (beta-lactamase class C family)